MKFPHTNFSAYAFVDWIERNKPTLIELTDHQYSILSERIGYCPTKYNAIPILFLDAPKAVIK